MPRFPTTRYGARAKEGAPETYGVHFRPSVRQDGNLRRRHEHVGRPSDSLPRRKASIGLLKCGGDGAPGLEREHEDETADQPRGGDRQRRAGVEFRPIRPVAWRGFVSDPDPEIAANSKYDGPAVG